ncbi:YwqG family protein [Sporosarcina obsidiansis]|uniref:YwqG family protein n=1 Tax=Sporosarcina obsidiansis TaxID=2660748 RepID=UPI001890E8DA|nr:YwqG family protein [Sporosarcina obsidiansis]
MTYEIPELLKKHENLIQSTFRYSNEIHFKREETKPWDSKLGGCPYLKSSEDYPTDADRNPMLFLAQINLADLEIIDELPEKGLLQFFVANDDLFGLEDPIHVNYIEDYEENEEHLVKKHPYENEEYKRNLPFSHSGKMYFTLREMPMSSSLNLFGDIFMNKLSEVEYEKLSDDCYSCDSRIGGYPYFVQHDYIGFDESDFLLLQLDIDEECGIMFGDSGNCVFSIPKDALKNRDFSKVVYDWQCC